MYLRRCHQNLSKNMTTNITADILQKYVETNEVVYQFCGELMEVLNDKEQENKEILLGYFHRANRVVVYTKNDRFVKDGWTELADWSTDDDVLFLLDGVGVLICIPKKEAVKNNFIVE